MNRSNFVIALILVMVATILAFYMYSGDERESEGSLTTVDEQFPRLVDDIVPGDEQNPGVPGDKYPKLGHLDTVLYELRDRGVFSRTASNDDIARLSERYDHVMELNFLYNQGTIPVSVFETALLDFDQDLKQTTGVGLDKVLFQGE